MEGRAKIDILSSVNTTSADINQINSALAGQRLGEFDGVLGTPTLLGEGFPKPVGSSDMEEDRHVVVGNHLYIGIVELRGNSLGIQNGGILSNSNLFWVFTCVAHGKLRGGSSVSSSFETAGYPPLINSLRQIIMVYLLKHPKILGLHFVRYLIFDKQGLSGLSFSAGICHVTPFIVCVGQYSACSETC